MLVYPAGLGYNVGATRPSLPAVFWPPTSKGTWGGMLRTGEQTAQHLVLSNCSFLNGSLYNHTIMPRCVFQQLWIPTQGFSFLGDLRGSGAERPFKDSEAVRRASEPVPGPAIAASWAWASSSSKGCKQASYMSYSYLVSLEWALLSSFDCCEAS